MKKEKHTTSVTKHHDRSNKTDDDEKTPHKIVDTYKTISINRLAWGGWTQQWSIPSLIVSRSFSPPTGRDRSKVEWVGYITVSESQIEYGIFTHTHTNEITN